MPLAESVKTVESLTEADQSSHEAKTLAMLFLAMNPAAAFVPSVPGVQCLSGQPSRGHSLTASRFSARPMMQDKRSRRNAVEAPVEPPSGKWELDFYSRPVQGADGKKLWELLVTDSVGSFRHVEAVPANCVNSKELRTRVQRLIDDSPVRPTEIRFFRGMMRNMITIALGEIEDCENIPSRACYQIQDWLLERQAEVYPEMPGYRPPRPDPPAPRFPQKLPDQLRGEQYAIVSLPMQEFRKGGGVDQGEVEYGRLCPLPKMTEKLPPDYMLAGLCIFSDRSRAVAAWFSGLDLACVTAAMDERRVYIELGLDTQYLLARLQSPKQLQEGESLEDSKRLAGGLHFLSISKDMTSEPDGFWLLRDPDYAPKR